MIEILKEYSIWIFVVVNLIVTLVTYFNELKHLRQDFNKYKEDNERLHQAMFNRIDEMKNIDIEQGKSLVRMDEKINNINSRIERIEEKENGRT